MPSKKKTKLTFAQFGDLLQQEWEAGNIDSEIHQYIEAGLVPIKLLRERLRWIIEREGDGLLISIANDDEELGSPDA